MFSDWTEKATKGFSEAWEKTGEALSQAEKSATRGITDALERTGEVITQAATQPGPRKSPSKERAAASSNDKAGGDDQRTVEAGKAKGDGPGIGGLFPGGAVDMPNIDKEKVLKNLQMGWSTVVESTKRTVEATKGAVEATKEAVELERSRIEQNFLRKKGFYKRDPKLPLDVDALRDAEVVYITDRIITMSHPALASNVNPSVTAERKLAAVGHLFHRRHDGRFLVWNLSEVDYDISILDDQVLTFSFPGSPSPPLGLLLKLLISMENWMKADTRNVAVVHCLTGRGRTSTVLAAFLCWMGEAGFGDINEALAYIAKCKQISPQELTIPSQRRYSSYFKNMLDGVRPSQPPLLLKRIIMSEAPKFARGPPREDMANEKEGDSPEENREKLMGCAPYLQIFKAGKLIFTTAATLHALQSEDDLPFVQVHDGSVPFHIEQVIQGDILIRCRHLTFKKQRVSMFRAAFHTGYVPPNVLRLSKSQLDGACTDKRYADDFFLDLIFEKVDAETATKHLEEQEAEEVTDGDGESKVTRGKGPIVTASSYDTMLHGDSRFWDVITKRRQEKNKQKDDNPLCGKTVGRRRGDQKKAQDGGKDAKGGPQNKRSSFETFSIGNEFDFLPSADKKQEKPPKEPKEEKDSLMEALNALDEEEAPVRKEEHPGTEEIVFHSASAKETKEPSFLCDPSEYMGLSPAQGDEGGAAAKTADSDRETTTESDSNLIGDTTTDIEDMDALLASAEDDFADLDLDGLDDDDDLEDLENMLKI